MATTRYHTVLKQVMAWPHKEAEARNHVGGTPEATEAVRTAGDEATTMTDEVSR